MSIIARRRLAGRSSRRLLRPLSALGVAAVTASLLAACSSSGGSSQTLVIVEWTNPAAVTWTQHIDSLFEKEHPGVTVHLETAPTANARLADAGEQRARVQGRRCAREFPPGPAGYPPSYTGIVRATRRRLLPRTSWSTWPMSHS